jgi:hypothetical protein
VAVRVYVVESCGLTEVELWSSTFPTPGSKSRLEAFCDDQLSVADSPLSTVAGCAFSVTVGADGSVSVGVGWRVAR